MAVDEFRKKENEEKLVLIRPVIKIDYWIWGI